MATRAKAKEEEPKTQVKTQSAPTEAEEYKERWLFAKKAASDNAAALKAASKELKTAQDSQLAAEEKLEEAEKVHGELVELQAVCDGHEKSIAALEKKLQKAESRVAAAEKIAEGLAELK